MSEDKYIGLDVHRASVSVAVLDRGGKLTMECMLETKAGTIVDFIQGVRGSVAVTRSSPTSCQPAGRMRPAQECPLTGWQQERPRRYSQVSRVVARQPAESGVSRERTLKELARGYLTLTQDLTRVMTRIKALYHPAEKTTEGCNRPEPTPETIGVLQSAGWRSRPKSPRPPVEGEVSS